MRTSILWSIHSALKEGDAVDVGALDTLAAIERKTLDDLAKSAGIVDRRAAEGTKVFRQLRDLLCHPMPVLIVEGAPSMLYRRVEPSLVGLQLWCAREGIAIIYATGPLASSHAVILLARRLARELTSLTIDEQVAFLLQQRATDDRNGTAPGSQTGADR